MDKVGIKETKELLIAINMLAVELIKLVKDGIQASDAAVLVAIISSNEPVKNALFAAFSNISAVPAEVKDLDVAEIVELVGAEVGLLPAILEAMKKDASVA